MLVKVKNFKTVLDLMENKNIKFVFLDLDNTLYSYLPCHKYALKKCYEEFKKLSHISYSSFDKLYKDSSKDVKKRLKKQASSHSRLLYFQRLFEVIYGKTDIENTLKFEEIYWQNFFKKIRVTQDAKFFLNQIKKKNIKIVLVTDLTARIQFEKLIYLQLNKLIDFVVSSEEIGVEKPDKKIFNLAIKKIGAIKKESIFIGDDVERDGAGGQNIGILTYIIKHETV